MGGLASRLTSLFDNFGKEHRRLLILGLDAAGKTTYVYKLKVGETLHTVPTIGFNSETIAYKNVEFSCMDIGGQDKIRKLWHHYYSGTDGLIFLVDSADTERLEEARDTLHKLLAEDELRDVSLLVMANKQDLPEAAKPSDLADSLELHKLRGRDWFIQGCTATTGDGLYEGLEWMSTSLKKK